MSEIEPARELLFARVVARLVSLRHAGAIHRPCDFAMAQRPQAPATSLTAMLWDWSMLISNTQRLITEVFEPSLREPGRLHQRLATEQRDRPRGAIHWPRTSHAALQGGHAGPLRFVCTAAARSLLAPENLLLIWTLDDFLARSLAVTLRVETSAMLGADDRELFHQFRRDVRRVLVAPWVSACREAVQELRRAGPRAEFELEFAVRERIRGRPSAAPDWARSLLELRRHRSQVPEDAALAEISADQLWSRFVWLELLTLLRSRTRLRQSSNPDLFRSPSGTDFHPLDDAPAWVLAGPGHPLIGILSTAELGWETVRREATYSCFEVRHRDLDIDRWLIIHRAAESPAMHQHRRHGIELFYWRLDARVGAPAEVTNTVTRWLTS